MASTVAKTNSVYTSGVCPLQPYDVRLRLLRVITDSVSVSQFQINMVGLGSNKLVPCDILAATHHNGMALCL